MTGATAVAEIDCAVFLGGDAFVICAAIRVSIDAE